MMAVAFTHSIDDRIRFAIARRRLIQLVYKGQTRLAEPHDYGIQNENVRLLIYQLRGPAKPGQSAIGWRLLNVPLIDSLLVLEDEFRGSRGAQHRDHHRWDVIYARVT